MNFDSKNNCQACRWWAQFAREQFFGVCGQPDHAGRTVDEFDTCKHFEWQAKTAGDSADADASRNARKKLMEGLLA